MQSLLQDVFGIALSVGAISESEAVLAAALAPAVEEAQTHVRQDRIEAILQRGGACEETRTANTCRQIRQLRQALWTFISTPGVEPTNNLSERTIRHYVIWRKICYGAQSARGSLYWERRMMVVGSCKLQGRNRWNSSRNQCALIGDKASPLLSYLLLRPERVRLHKVQIIGHILADWDMRSARKVKCMWCWRFASSIKQLEEGVRRQERFPVSR